MLLTSDGAFGGISGHVTTEIEKYKNKMTQIVKITSLAGVGIQPKNKLLSL